MDILPDEEAYIPIRNRPEDIRRKKGCYFSSFYGCIFLLLDECLRELNRNVKKQLEVTLELENFITIRDTGPGWSISATSHPRISNLEWIFTDELFFSLRRWRGKSGYAYSTGVPFPGPAHVNALCESLLVSVSQEGKRYGMSFSKGAITEPFRDLGESSESGNQIRFQLDTTIFPEAMELKPGRIAQRLEHIAAHYPGLEVILHDDRSQSQKTVRFHFSGGLLDYFDSILVTRKMLLPAPLSGFQEETVTYGDDAWKNSAQFYLRFTEYPFGNIEAFVNSAWTPKGDHINGFREVVTSVVRSLAQKKLTFDEISSGLGLRAVLSLQVPRAMFEDADSSTLILSVENLICEPLRSALKTYIDQDPDLIKKIKMLRRR